MIGELQLSLRGKETVRRKPTQQCATRLPNGFGDRRVERIRVIREPSRLNSLTWIKTLSTALGVCALLIAIILDVTHPDRTSPNLAGGSGDSPATSMYAQPTVPAMSLTASGMTLGKTATAATPAATLATSVASPTFRASPAPTCVNNGQCP
jgi:glycerol uptake facilitator-like aquaporin